MENFVGGNLLNAINKMNKIPENLAKIIFKQLIKTIQYIHSNGNIHRDIKPDNILLDLNNTIKICDFGVSKIFRKTTYSKFMWNPRICRSRNFVRLSI